DPHRIVYRPRQTGPGPIPAGNGLDAQVVAVAPPHVPLLAPAADGGWLTHAPRLEHPLSWEAARGVEVADLRRDSGGPFAARLAAGSERATLPFRNVVAVVLHLGTIVTRDRSAGADGLMSDGPNYLAGQSGHGRGPLLIDWRTFRRERRVPQRGL